MGLELACIAQIIATATCELPSEELCHQQSARLQYECMQPRPASKQGFRVAGVLTVAAQPCLLPSLALQQNRPLRLLQREHHYMTAISRCMCLQDGVAQTGVSVAFTVLKCDAGPVFLQEAVVVPDDEQAPQLLERLFRQGAQLLITNIDRVWTGEAAQLAQQQDEAQATHAAKVRVTYPCEGGRRCSSILVGPS